MRHSVETRKGGVFHILNNPLGGPCAELLVQRGLDALRKGDATMALVYADATRLSGTPGSLHAISVGY